MRRSAGLAAAMAVVAGIGAMGIGLGRNVKLAEPGEVAVATAEGRRRRARVVAERRARRMAARDMEPMGGAAAARRRRQIAAGILTKANGGAV